MWGSSSPQSEKHLGFFPLTSPGGGGIKSSCSQEQENNWKTENNTEWQIWLVGISRRPLPAEHSHSTGRAASFHPWKTLLSQKKPHQTQKNPPPNT